MVYTLPLAPSADPLRSGFGEAAAKVVLVRDDGVCDLKVYLDVPGPGVLWVTEVSEGTGPHTWRFPPDNPPPTRASLEPR